MNSFPEKTFRHIVATFFCITFVMSNSVAQSTTVPTGSYIVNMGVTPQTEDNALKPYGMVFEIIREEYVSIHWSINPSKGQDGTDFTYNGIDYKGGPFIISAEYRTAAVNAIISRWESQGVVGVTTTSDFIAPIFMELDYIMNWTLDAANGKIAKEYLDAAGIPSTYYNWVEPQDLTCCNDLFLMPHADPEWDTHGNLYNWVKSKDAGGCGGAIWAACHAVSALENSYNPSNNSEQMNFLSQVNGSTPANGEWADNSLVLWGDHEDGSPAYSYNHFGHPVMQFMGDIDDATENGSEQVFLPHIGGGWRPETYIGAWDPDQSDLGSQSPGEAAIIAFGDAFGDNSNGKVMYEAGHSHNKSNDEDNIAAMRAMLNFSFWASEGQSIGVITNVPSNATVNVAIPLTATATGGSEGYTYEWIANCSGTFSNAYSANPTFTPSSVGTCIIQCIVTDPCGREAFSSVVMVVANNPQPPTAADDVTTVDECGIVTINIIANDNDPEGGALKVTALGTSANGTWVNSGTGRVTFTPNTGFTGIDMVTYTICDPSNLCDDATITVTVNANTAPTATDDFESALRDSPLNINVLSNDTDPENGNLSINILTQPADGSVSLVNNQVLFQPDAGFIGNTTFTYEACDNACTPLCDPATVTVDVGCNPIINEANILGAVFFDEISNGVMDGNEMGQDNVTVNLYLDVNMDGMVDGGDTFVEAQTTDTNGAYSFTLTNIVVPVNGGIYDDVPSSTVSIGPDEDCFAPTIIRTITIADSYAITDVDFGFNATHTFRGDISVTLESPAGTVVVIMNETVGIDNSENFDILLDDEFTGDIYTGGVGPDDDISAPFYDREVAPSNPLSAFNTEDAMGDWILTICDGADIDGGTYNRSQLVINKGGATTADYVIEIDQSTLPLGGSVMTTDTVARASFTGLNEVDCSNNFGYNVANNPPIALDDSETTEQNVAVDIMVLINDSDSDGDSIGLQSPLVSNPTQGGTVVIDNNGTPADFTDNFFKYTPAPNFAGVDTFVYSICDTGSPSLCDIATVTVTINALINDPPVAIDDTALTEQDVAICINVLNNDSDPEGDNIGPPTSTGTTPTATDGMTISGGIGTINASGEICYTPPIGYIGLDSLEYIICDPDGRCDTATVVITVTAPVNTLPNLIDDNGQACTNTAEIINVVNNDSDSDGNLDLATLTISAPAANGMAVANGDGTVTYTSNVAFTGTDTFEYQICDDGAPTPIECATALVTVTVTTSNTAPTAIDDVEETNVNELFFFNVLENDSDLENNNLTVTIITPPINGVVNVLPNGLVSYMPNTDFEGSDPFTYQICDDGCPSFCATAIATAVVTNQAPIAIDDYDKTGINTPVTVDVLDNDIEPDGHNIELSSFGTEASDNVTNQGGTLGIDDNGTPGDATDDLVVFTPMNGYTGLDTFLYRVCDDFAPIECDTAQVIISITPPIDLEVTKTVIAPNLIIGNDYAFTITVLNNSSETGTGIFVKDQLPAELTYVSDNSGGSYDTSSGIWNVGNLSGNASLSIEITATLNNIAAINIAEVSGANQFDIDSAPNNDDGDQSEDDEAAAVIENPMIVVTKSSNLDLGIDGIATVGDTINYDFVISNTGNVTLNPIALSDSKATLTGCDSTSLQVGNMSNCSGYYLLTQEDIDAGEVLNIAIAMGTSPTGMIVIDTSNSINPSDTLPDGSPTDTTTTLIPEMPSILVTKGSSLDLGIDGIATVGDTINYDFVVSNTGNVTLNPIGLSDGKATLTGCDSTSLQVGNMSNCSGYYLLTQVDIDAGEVLNIAVATGTSPMGTMVVDTSMSSNPSDTLGDGSPTDTTTTLIPEVPSIMFTKGSSLDLGIDGIATVGDTINYDFVVSNTGNVTLNPIGLSDSKATLTGCDSTSLQVGNTSNCSGYYLLIQTDIDAGEVLNIAVATGRSPMGTMVVDTSRSSNPADTLPDGSPTDTTVTLIPEMPDIELTKGSSLDVGLDGIATVGDTINYDFVVTNTGNVTLSSIVLTDDKATIVGCDSTSLLVGNTSNCSGYYLLSQVDIDAGEVLNIATVVARSPMGTVVMDTSVSSNLLDTLPDGSPTDTTVTLIPEMPDIELTKGSSLDVGLDGIATVGDTINYDFVVSNTGNVTLNPIGLSDSKATLTGCDSTSLQVGNMSNCSGYYLLTQTDIDAGEVLNIAIATGTSPMGTMVVDTSVSSNPVDTLPDGSPTDTTTTLIPETPVIELTKGSILDLGLDGIATVGDTINYNFVVTNSGNVSLSAITLTDDQAIIVGCDSTSLEVGNMSNCSGYYLLSQVDIDAGEVLNIAMVEGTSPMGTMVMDTSVSSNPVDTLPDGSPTDTTTTLIPETPVIELTKGSSLDVGLDGIATVGDTINYDFVVTNSGNVSLSAITLTDDQAIIVGCDSTSLEVGNMSNCSGYYLLTQVDINVGEVLNIATVVARSPMGTMVMDTSTSTNPVDTLPDGSPTDTTTTLIPEMPDIELTKGSMLSLGIDGISTVGDTINYDFVVINIGNVPLSAITLTDEKATIVGCDSTALQVGKKSSCTGFYLLTQADINAGEVLNIAEVVGTSPIGTMVIDTSDSTNPNDERGTDRDTTVTPIDENPLVPLDPASSISLIKSISEVTDNGDGIVGIGDTVHYKFRIENTGDVPLTNVRVIDGLVDVIGGPIDSLGVDEINEDEFTASYILNLFDVAKGGVENTAIVIGMPPIVIDANQSPPVIDTSDSGTEPVVDRNTPIVISNPEGTETDALDPLENDGILDNDPTVFLITPLPKIELVKNISAIKENGDGITNAGDTIVYFFKVSNIGNVILRDISIVDTIVNVRGGPITLEGGTSDSTAFSARYIITQNDVDNGYVQNSATAFGTATFTDGSNHIVSDISDTGDPSETGWYDGTTDLDPHNDPAFILLCKPAILSCPDWNLTFSISTGSCIAPPFTDIEEIILTTNADIEYCGDPNSITVTHRDSLVQEECFSQTATAFDQRAVIRTYYFIDTNSGDTLSVCPQQIVYTIDQCQQLTDFGRIGINGSTEIELKSSCDIPEITVDSEENGICGYVEYMWLISTQEDANGNPFTPTAFNIGSVWQLIPNAFDPTLDPGMVSQNTYYVRCARNFTCCDFGESNIVSVRINPRASCPINNGAIVNEDCENVINLLSPQDDYTNGANVKHMTNLTITAENKVTGKSQLSLHAGNAIIMKPGFEIQDTSLLEVHIDGCNE